MFDVQFEGRKYRVLPAHVMNTPNHSILSVNIEEDRWVNVPRKNGKCEMFSEEKENECLFDTILACLSFMKDSLYEMLQ